MEPSAQGSKGTGAGLFRRSVGALVTALVTALGPRLGQGEERAKRAALVLATATITVLASVWVATYLWLGLPLAATMPFAYQAASLVTLVLFVATGWYGMYRFTQHALWLVLPFALQWTLGGFVNSSVVSFWSLIPALGAVIFYSPRGAAPWFAGYIALTVASVVAEPTLARDAPPIPEAVRSAFFALNVFGVSFTAYTLLQYFVRQRDHALAALDLQNRALATERAKSDRLLRNVLPETIAARLRERSEVIADSHPSASVLFADVVDFTPFAERTPPRRVVELLDRVFSAFDELAEHHGLEKIKTIGDAYMVVGGVPEARPDHLEAVVEMALDMLDAVRVAAEPPLSIRIGIHTGPVIAGVIGRRKFAYDLWGDTVNTASRMESSGLPGRVHVTEPVYLRLRDRYEFEARGSVEIKGKGRLRSWFLVGRAASATRWPAGSDDPSAATTAG